MLSKIGSYEFMAEPFHCDFSNHLFLGHLGNHLLNAADFHSNERGYGMHYLNTVNKTWVLSRLVIEMKEMPEAYDKLTVDTWVEGVMRYFTDRDFAITGAGGKVYGYGRSVWAMIDTASRQPADILAVNDGLILSYIEKDKECPIAKSSRVRMSGEATHVGSVTTHYSDVDINGHINSVKYIEHVLDLWDTDWYKSHRVARFEIAYVAESHGGDTLHFMREQTAGNEYCVRIMRQAPGTDQKVEVCRSKVIFVKE